MDVVFVENFEGDDILIFFGKFLGLSLVVVVICRCNELFLLWNYDLFINVFFLVLCELVIRKIIIRY